MKTYLNATFLLLGIAVLLVPVSGIVRRCWTCRSRGEYGDCRDPFNVHPNNQEAFPGVEPAPCASGWCAKIVEGDELEYSVATERMCLQRPPDDNQERCAETQWKHGKVFMCFCMGDLCNGASGVTASVLVLATALAAFLFRW